MTINCQDCGRIIYWDDDMKEPVKGIDDISAPPYVTESGDLFCSICGPDYDEEPDDGYADKYDFYYESEEKTAEEVKKKGKRGSNNTNKKKETQKT